MLSDSYCFKCEHSASVSSPHPPLARSPFPAGEGKFIVSFRFLNFGMDKSVLIFIRIHVLRDLYSKCSLLLKDLPRWGRGTAQAVDEGKRRSIFVSTKLNNEWNLLNSEIVICSVLEFVFI